MINMRGIQIDKKAGRQAYEQVAINRAILSHFQYLIITHGTVYIDSKILPY